MSGLVDPVRASRLASVMLAAAVVGSVLAVHPHRLAAFGAHASLKSAVALGACALAVWATQRALMVSRSVVLFMALEVVAGASAISRGAPLRELGALLAAPMLLVVGNALARDEARRAIAIRAIVIGAGAAAAIAIAEIVWLELPWSHVRRPQSTLVNRNFLAHYLAAALPLLLVRSGTTRGRLFKLVAIAAFTYVLLVTRCRAAWVGLFATGALWFVMRATSGRPITGPSGLRAAPTVAAACLGAALTFMPVRLAFHEGIDGVAGRVLEYDSGSGAGRLAQAKVGILSAMRSPVLGAGLGGWRRQLSSHTELRAILRQDADIGRTPNSDVVRALVEGGLPAAIAVAAACALLAFGFARETRRSTSPRNVGLLASGTVLAVVAFLDAPLFRPETALVFGMALAAAPPLRPATAVHKSLLLAAMIPCLIACGREAWPG